MDLQGDVVHLTDQSVPDIKAAESSPEVDARLLSEENWKEIEEMMTVDGKSVEIDVTDKSKEERISIHKALRAKYDGIISNTRAVDGKSIMEIVNPSDKKKDTRWIGPAYTQFVLYKENMTTVEAIGELSRQLR